MAASWFLCVITLASSVLLSPVTSQTAGDETTYVPLHVYTPEMQAQTCPSSEVRMTAQDKLNENIEDLIAGRPCHGPDWRRIAFLNMSDPNQQCPSDLAETSYSIRSCGRNGPTTNCWSVIYSSGGAEYSQVCGKATAYQYGQNSAFYPSISDSHLTVEDRYLDGLSITHGTPGSRQHIWSFAIAYYEGPGGNIINAHCPCDSAYRNAYPPAFIRNDYFCESGAMYDTRSGTPTTNRLYPDDPLWDGKGCVQGDTRVDYTCCDFNNPPWFVKHLTNPTTDDIELRLCSLGNSDYSNIALEQLEIYVR